MLHVLTVNHSAFQQRTNSSTYSSSQATSRFSVRPRGPYSSTHGRAPNERTETEINNYDETKTQTRMLAFPKDEDETRTKRNEAFRCTETERKLFLAPTVGELLLYLQEPNYVGVSFSDRCFVTYSIHAFHEYCM